MVFENCDYGCISKLSAGEEVQTDSLLYYLLEILNAKYVTCIAGSLKDMKEKDELATGKAVPVRQG
jgi:hypothetical protein